MAMKKDCGMFKIVVKPLVKNLHPVFKDKLIMYGFELRNGVYTGKYSSTVRGIEFYKRYINSPQLRVYAVKVGVKKHESTKG